MSEKPVLIDEKANAWPESMDAEKSVLGSILDQGEMYYQATAEVAAGDFYYESHQRIFRCMKDLADAGTPIDISTMIDALTRSRQLEAIGGRSYLFGLTEMLPRLRSIQAYARTVREKSMLREIMECCRHFDLRASDMEPSAQLVGLADQQLLGIIANHPEQQTLKVQLDVEYEKLIDQMHGINPPALSTGVGKLDEKIGGITRGELTVLAARPGQGKSFFINQLVINHCSNGVPCHVFSLEMTAGQLLRRIWAAVAGIPFSVLRRPKLLTDDEHRANPFRRDLSDPEYADRLDAAIETVSTWPLVIDDSASITVEQLIARARIQKRQQSTQFVAIDYLQKMRFGTEIRERHNGVSEAAVAIAGMAKQEQMAVLLVSSMTEPRNGNTNEPPKLADLRESGTIKYEASTVLFIHREVDVETKKTSEHGFFIVAKARSDEDGAVPVRFDRTTLQFVDREEAGNG